MRYILQDDIADFTIMLAGRGVVKAERPVCLAKDKMGEVDAQDVRAGARQDMLPELLAQGGIIIDAVSDSGIQ